MKTKLLALALLVAPVLAFAAEPKQVVDINLGGTLLSFASRAAKDSDPQAAALLKGLKSVHVRVYDLTEGGRAEALEQMKQLRGNAAKASYTPIVTVADKKNNDVVVLVRQGADSEIINGLILTALDEEQNGVVIEIDGEIRADQLSSVVKGLHIDGVPSFKTKADKACENET